MGARCIVIARVCVWRSARVVGLQLSAFDAVVLGGAGLNTRVACRRRATRQGARRSGANHAHLQAAVPTRLATARQVRKRFTIWVLRLGGRALALADRPRNASMSPALRRVLSSQEIAVPLCASVCAGKGSRALERPAGSQPCKQAAMAVPAAQSMASRAKR